MSPWLFNVYMDDFMRETKVRNGETWPRLMVRSIEQSLVAGLFVDDSVVGRE